MKNDHLWTSLVVPFLLCPSFFGVASAISMGTVLEDNNYAASGGRVLVASGASRSRAGWTLGAESDSLDLRAVFKVNLKQCNTRLLESEALAVSDPDSPRYGHHLSPTQVCAITSCPGRVEGLAGVLEWLLGPALDGGLAARDVAEAAVAGGSPGEWVRSEGGGDDAMAKVHCSHIAVSMSASAAAAAFPEAAFRSHHRTATEKRGGTRAVLRATGDILIPETVSKHVAFVSGLTELWVPHVGDSGMGKLDGGGGRARFGGMETGDFTEVMIQPRTLRALYGVPDGERGGWAGRGHNRQGVAAFDDFYLAADLCAAHNLLAPDSKWLDPPDVTYRGPGFDPAADEAESDLDTQYMTLMGPGVPVTFANYAEGEWVLDWAQEASEGDLTPAAGGPLVWSVSYGFPEEWQCYVADALCEGSGAPHGYDPTVYLERANEEFAKLAALGVSVLVASGDDGAGQFATCPVDARMPVDVTGGAVEGMETACPFDSREDCKCGSFQMELLNATTGATSRCILPLGIVASSLGIEAPGADCADIFSSTDCLNLLENIERNGTALQPPSSPRDENEQSLAKPASCQMAFSAGNASFYSDCECGAVPTLAEGQCTVSGYTFESGRDGSTPFAPSFPASSQWVTSVGATQVAWDLDGSCQQSDLLGPDNARNAETAVNKFTGGFDGGGGFSTVFPAPEYQRSHVEGYVASDAAPPSGTFNKTNRGFPDVSAAGHNYVVVVAGKVMQIGGTSASAPALAGMVSLMNERLLAAGKSPLGFLNPALYKAADDGAGAFQAVLPRTYNLSGTPLEDTLGASYQVGSNKCSRYSCCDIGFEGSVEGTWDPVTGLGTINYQALADYLNVPPSPPRPEPSRGHDRHHAAYVAWIVVLVFGFASAMIFLVYEHRPKLILSAESLGRSMRNMGGGDGKDDDRDGGSWLGGGGAGSEMSRRGRRPRGALTEMVMESEIGVVGGAGDAAYRLLEEDDDEVDGEGSGGEGRGEGDARRSV